MQKKRFFGFLCAMVTGCVLLLTCESIPVVSAPPLSQKDVTWNSDLPSAIFPAAADKVDVIVYREGVGLGTTITSLMAIVNAEQPRIAIDSDNRLYVFNRLGIKYNAIYDPYILFSKYSSYITKAVIWDEAVPDTLNLACTYAGLNGAVVLTRSDYNALGKRGISPDVIADYRGQFSRTASESEQRLAVYGFLYDNYYEYCTHRIITSQSPYNIKLRDYSMAVGSAIIFLSFNGAEGELANKFFSRAEAGNSAVLGWAPDGDEGGLVNAASLNGMYVWAADHSQSLTLFAADAGQTPVLPVKSVAEFLAQGRVRPAVYVAIGVSDGDNLQYMQGAMFDKFGDQMHRNPRMPALSWTINPAASEVIPVVYNYFIQAQANDFPQDGFLTGPSGIGYFYPYRMYGTARQNDMLAFFGQTSRYLAKTGINTISVWYRGVGDPEVSDDFLRDVAPRLPGVSAMLFQRKDTPRGRGGVLFSGWDDPYNDNFRENFERQIKGAFDRFASDGRRAEYVSLQAVPWDGQMFQHLLEVRETSDSLTSGSVKGGDVIKYVTIDQLVQLQRIEMGLAPINRN